MSGHDADMATDRNTATAITVTANEAAQLAGVSPRTIRRWIKNGWLASNDGLNGHEVYPADLPEAARRARQGHGHDRDHGHDTPAADMDTVADTAMTARGQLDAVMQQWLAPLVDRIGKLERENGRLEQERDTQAETIAKLRERLAVAEAENASPAAPQPLSAMPPPDAHDDTPSAPGGVHGFLQRVRRVFGGE